MYYAGIIRLHSVNTGDMAGMIARIRSIGLMYANVVAKISMLILVGKKRRLSLG
jgi:hypothetical protein